MRAEKINRSRWLLEALLRTGVAQVFGDRGVGLDLHHAIIPLAGYFCRPPRISPQLYPNKVIDGKIHGALHTRMQSQGWAPISLGLHTPVPKRFCLPPHFHGCQQESCGSTILLETSLAKEDRRVYQRTSRACDKKRRLLARLQNDPQIASSGKRCSYGVMFSQARDHRRKLPSSTTLRDRVLCHAGKSRRSSLHGEYFCLLILLDNIDLGTACGKFFRVGCLGITNPGDSDITQEFGLAE